VIETKFRPAIFSTRHLSEARLLLAARVSPPFSGITMKRSRSYSGDLKRAAVASYSESKAQDPNVAKPAAHHLSLARASAGHPGRATMYRWLKQDLSPEAIAERKSHSRRRPKLSDAQQWLLVGHAIALRLKMQPVSSQDLIAFSSRIFTKVLRQQYVSEVMRRFKFSYQRALPRNSRMIDQVVVNSAIQTLHQIRQEGWQPQAILVMDETGIWSNTVPKYTYHMQNWYEIEPNYD
jgi:transposase-like protein